MDQPPGAGPPVNVIATNIDNGTLPADGRIEISFDRLLLPVSITRQTFVLQQSGAGGGFLTPTVAYDPVARVVVITPPAALQPSQPYQLTITTPSGPHDINGLRAIDGATLAPSSTATFGFVAGPAAGSGTPPPPTTYVDFCTSVAPIFSNCTVCHTVPASLDPSNGMLTPSQAFYGGLGLSSAIAVSSTALGIVAHGANTGPLAGSGQPPGLLFTQDMPIIDPGPGPIGAGVDAGAPSTSGDPGHSWLMYKVLMAEPLLPDSSDAGVSPGYTVTCAGGAPCPQPLPDDERARLANMVIGREMPYPAPPSSGPGSGLGLNDLETLDQWIAGGAPLPASLTCQ
jgi:hypothetical protein